MTSGLNVLWQNEHYPDPVKGGGGAVNTYYIARAMLALGHRPVILSRGAAPGPPVRDEHKGTSIIRTARPALPPRLWPLWPLLEPRALRDELAELADPFQAFVCIDTSYALALKRLFPRRPLLYRIEGTDRRHDRSIPPSTRRAPPATLRARLLGRLLHVEGEWMDHRAWRVADALIVKSAFMRRDLETLYGVERGRAQVIPNGVDFERYATARPSDRVLDVLRKPTPETLVIAYAGRLVSMKNLPFLLDAFARMRARDRALLMLVGDGDQRQALEARVAALGIGDRVRFTGHTDRAEEFLAAADVFVLPSTYEPFGNVLVEAMAAGLPCLALRPDFEAVATASAEIIDDGETGMLVDGRDPVRLADALDSLADDPALRVMLGRNGQKRCEARFSWTECAKAYLRLMADAAPGPRASR